VRKTIFGLLRSSRPVLLMTVLVAVVGVTGTAYAGNHDSGDKKQGNNSHSDKNNHNGHYDFGDHTGHKKHKGDRGAAYGVATVSVSRGVVNGVWALYSTRLGSPVGDTTGGVFRFTCHAVQAPCKVSVQAADLGAADYAIYPRVLVYKQGDGDGGGSLAENYCEYGDGSSGTAPLPLTHQALSATPTYTAVPVNIGGSADCGATPVVPIGNGDVPAIIVPAGYYDVHSTFSFIPLP
jgi:hypothetical protein